MLLALFGLWLAGTFLPALIWAAVIAIAIDPLYTRAEARWPRGRRALLPGIATLLIALLVLAPLALAVIEALREARMLLQWMESARETGLPEPAWLARLPFPTELGTWWRENLGTAEATQHQLHRFRGSMLLEQSQLLGRGVLKRVVVFVFTLFALFFVLRDRDLLVDQLHAAGNRLLGPSGERIGTQVTLSVRGTIDGIVLVSIGMGAVMAVAYVVAGVAHPLLFGLFTAVGAMIPFGAALVFGVAAASLVAAGAVGAALGVFGFGMVLVGIADHFLRPLLIGGATRLPFLLVLIGILGGVESLGLLGLFVGPATMATLILLWREFVSRDVSVPQAPPASPADLPPPDGG